MDVANEPWPEQTYLYLGANETWSYRVYFRSWQLAPNKLVLAFVSIRETLYGCVEVT